MASAPQATIKVGPLCWPIDVSVLEVWLVSAEPGDEIVYSHGLVEAHAAPVWKRAAELAGEGEVRLHWRRRADGKTREWFAVRRVPEIAADAPLPPSSSGAGDDADEVESAALLRVLRRHARLGQACPTNKALDAHFGWPEGRTAYRFRCLRALNAIRVEDQGPGKPRVVAIVGTRLVTAR